MESKCYDVINRMCPKQIGILEFDISSRESQLDTIAQLKEKNISLSLIDNVVFFQSNEDSPMVFLGNYKSKSVRNMNNTFNILLIVEIDLNLYSKYLFEEFI